jgi:hypothetical protein
MTSKAKAPAAVFLKWLNKYAKGIEHKPYIINMKKYVPVIKAEIHQDYKMTSKK